MNTNLSSILKYWGSSGLASIDSSTSGADPDIAWLDNQIESKHLLSLINKQACLPINSLIDIGAGYGRFVPFLLPLCQHMLLVEGAMEIYSALCKRFGNKRNIEIVNSSFEELCTKSRFNIAVASGILYLYDESEVKNFFKRLVSLLQCDESLLIVRDFVSFSFLTKKSMFIDGGFCRYRTIEWWRKAANECGLDLVEYMPSKPVLTMLRSNAFLKITRLLRIKRQFFRSHLTLFIAFQLSPRKLRKQGVNTVFLCFKPLSTNDVYSQV